MNLRIDYLSRDRKLLETVSEWLHREFSHYNPGETLQIRIGWFEPRMGSTEIPLTLVAFLDDEPVGTASLIANDMEDRPELSPWLASVFVLPTFRGRGIASALCRRVVEEAKRLGHKTLYLFTPDQEALYAKLGWERFELTKYHGEPVVLMKLDPRKA